jgi:TLD
MVFVLRNTSSETSKTYGIGFGTALQSSQHISRSFVSKPSTYLSQSSSHFVETKRYRYDYYANPHEDRDSNKKNTSDVHLNRSKICPQTDTQTFTLIKTYLPSSTLETSENKIPINRRQTVRRDINALMNQYAGKIFSFQSLPPAPQAPTFSIPIGKRQQKMNIDTLKEGRDDESTSLRHIIQHASSLLSEKYWEDREERQRQLNARKRISQCLIHIRAASQRSIEWRETMKQSSNQSQRFKRLRLLLGDVGSTLFAPLDLDVIHPLDSIDYQTNTKPDWNTTNNQEINPNDTCDDDVSLDFQMVPEPKSILMDCPQILNQAMRSQLLSYLPASVQIMTCQRLFTLARDGDSFLPMIHRCNAFHHTLLVIETVEGYILGGYTCFPWGKQACTAGRSYYGSGQSFLFASHPDGFPIKSVASQNIELQVFTWTRENDLFQLCNVVEEKLAMGGGGNFGLAIQDNFSRGTTACCSTFGNPALIPFHTNIGGTFDVLNLEIYGFASMSQLLMEREQ